VTLPSGVLAQQPRVLLGREGAVQKFEAVSPVLGQHMVGARHQRHRHIMMLVPNAAGKVDAGYHRHHDVREYDVDVIVVRANDFYIQMISLGAPATNSAQSVLLLLI
jgi:hypothetical protein